VTAPAPLLHAAASLPPNHIISVLLNADEEVRWIWTHTLGGSYVSGYTIVQSRPEGLRKSKRKTGAKR
jgi:hypothetical protein